MIKIGLNGKQGGGKSYISKHIAKNNQNILAFDGSNLSLQLMNLYLKTQNIEDIKNANVSYQITSQNVLKTIVNGGDTLKPTSTKEELMTKMKAYELRNGNMDVWNAIFAKTRDFIKDFSAENDGKYHAIVVTGRNFDVLMPDADMRFYITADTKKRQNRASTRDTAEKEIIEQREKIEEGIFSQEDGEIVFDTSPYNTTQEVDVAIDEKIMPLINERIGQKPVTVLLVGVSNAGKSTLLSDLCEKYPDIIKVPEMAATYMREHEVHVTPEQMTPEVFNAISRTQIETVNAASQNKNGIMCVDGNPLILYLSGKILFYHDKPELLQMGIQYTKRADIVVWCDEKNIEFEQTHENGMERGPEWLNDAMKGEYLQILEDNGIDHETVSGTREQRVEQVERIIGRYMSKRQQQEKPGNISLSEIGKAVDRNKNTQKI